MIVSPHATVVDEDDDHNCCQGGGALCPPLSGPSRPAGRLSLSSMSLTVVHGGGKRDFGAWAYMWWRRMRSAPLHSFVRFRSSQGWTMGEEEQSDVGGITWLSTSGWGRRRRRCCAMRAMTLMTTATGEGKIEGEMEGEVDMYGEGGWKGKRFV